jgi:predicted TIM-barrel fold metal-dependent hydrolase
MRFPDSVTVPASGDTEVAVGSSPVSPRLDFHVHLAGIGDGNTRCFTSEPAFFSPVFALVRLALGFFRAHRRCRVDLAYRRALVRDFAMARAGDYLDGLLVFAHDQIFTDAGEPRPVQEMFVPNTYVFDFCRRHTTAGVFLPAMSIHPYRADAAARTEFWIHQGAAAMKWLPNSQNIDPKDPRTEAIYELLAHFRVPLIVHTGGEHTVTVLREEWADPGLFRGALRRGVTVVFAHCGTASGFTDVHFLEDFKRLVKEYPNAWGDTSALCSFGRCRWLPELLGDSEVVGKLIHGSDFPIPPICLPWGRNGPGWLRAALLQTVPGFLARDVAMKRAWGFPESHFRQGWNLVPLSARKIWAGNPAFRQ